MQDITKILVDGGIAVIPTDTLYGVVARAHNRLSVDKLYALKGRSSTKPFIILINAFEDIETFGIKVSLTERLALSEYWPGPFSIVLSCPADDYAYLHRGKKSLAFRMPAKETLRQLLKITGPLVAPSANPEGEAPAQSIEEAKAYFGDRVDAYFSGDVPGQPSTIIKFTDGAIEVLRP